MGEQGDGGSRLQGDSARNPLPRDLAPGPPAPKGALPSPGSRSLPPPCLLPPTPRPPALCPQEGGLQDFQPSLGCLLSFSKPSSRRRREPCQDKSPSPLPLPAPSPSLEFPAPAAFPNSFPFPTLAPAPPSPTSLGSQVPSSGWRGSGELHNLREALVKPRSAGRP